jgi:hypothetical protein
MADSKSDDIKPVTANEFVEQELHRNLREIEKVFSCHARSLSGPLYPGVDDILRSVIEKRCVRDLTSKKLVILLTTPGGMLEPVQRMVATIRRH